MGAVLLNAATRVDESATQRIPLDSLTIAD
jgi:hypothetical protein